MADIDQVLEERVPRYGVFKDLAIISQGLKSVLYEHKPKEMYNLAPDMREALEMICHKMARIINGDPNYADSWIDIAGYATLVAQRLMK